MRLSLFSLLLLTAATPALAMQPEPDGPGERAEAQEAPKLRFDTPRYEERRHRDDNDASRIERAERPERVERAERFEPSIAASEPVREVPPASVASEGWSRPAPAERSEPLRDVARAAIAEQWSRPPEGDQARQPVPDSDATPGRRWRGGNDERRARARDLPPTAGSPVFGSTIPTPETVTRPGREVSTSSVAAGNLREQIAAEGLRRDRLESERWRRDWRQDRRYDWRRHRDYDRSRFHLGIYVDPFGWRYRDYDIGWRLPGRFYSSRYWVHDPWYYRLPPVGGPYRWVRYYDDVLLVDLRSGRVLDRIRGFFWSSRRRW